MKRRDWRWQGGDELHLREAGAVVAICRNVRLSFDKPAAYKVWRLYDSAGKPVVMPGGSRVSAPGKRGIQQAAQAFVDKIARMANEAPHE